MLAADDGKPATLANIREVRVRWDDPNDSPDAGKRVFDSMFPIVEAHLSRPRRQGAEAAGPSRAS